MGQPAARVTDVHLKGPILEGSSDVLIGSLPAARKGDLAQHGKKPEPIVEGEPTVLINGRAAARLGDKLACGEVIASGCGSVLIGQNAGRCLAEAAQSGATFVYAMQE